MSIEFERKFRASEQIHAALRQMFPGEEVLLEMQTTYYDTPAGDLSRRHYTLRRRLENGRSVCALKAPAGDLGRGEWEVDCEDIREAIPELCKLSGLEALALFSRAGLIPVCGARFTRIAKVLHLGQTVAELALDRGVLIGGDKEVPLWEVEVELKEGNREDVDAFCLQIAQLLGLVPEERSKFRRALALYRGE